MKLSQSDIDFLLSMEFRDIPSQGMSECSVAVLFDPLKEGQEVLCQNCYLPFRSSSSGLVKRDLRHVKPLLSQSGSRLAIFKEYECKNRHQITASNEIFTSAFEVCGILKKYIVCKRFVITRALSMSFFFDIGHGQSLSLIERKWPKFRRWIDQKLDETSPFSLVTSESSEFALNRDVIRQLFLMEFTYNLNRVLCIFCQNLENIECLAIEYSSIYINCIKFFDSKKPEVAFKYFLSVMDGVSGAPVMFFPVSSDRPNEVEEIFRMLRDACPNLKTIVSDLCCEQNNDLRTIFPSSVEFKIRFKPLMDRIMSVMPPKHDKKEIFSKLVQCLVMPRPEIVQDLLNEDKTASEKEILENFDSLLCKTSEIFLNDPISTKLTIAIANERKHFRCLSRVPKACNETDAFPNNLKGTIPMTSEHPSFGLSQIYATIFFVYEDKIPKDSSCDGSLRFFLQKKIVSLLPDYMQKNVLDFKSLVDLSKVTKEIERRLANYIDLYEAMQRIDDQNSLLVQLFGFQKLVELDIATLKVSQSQYMCKALKILGVNSPNELDAFDQGMMDATEKTLKSKDKFNEFLSQDVRSNDFGTIVRFLDWLGQSSIFITNLEILPVCSYVPKRLRHQNHLTFILYIMDNSNMSLTLLEKCLSKKSSEERVTCSCGGHFRDKACEPKKGSRCPCVKADLSCDEKCLCRKCANDKEYFPTRQVKKSKYSKTSMVPISSRKCQKALDAISYGSNVESGILEENWTTEDDLTLLCIDEEVDSLNLKVEIVQRVMNRNASAEDVQKKLRSIKESIILI